MRSRTAAVLTRIAAGRGSRPQPGRALAPARTASALWMASWTLSRSRTIEGAVGCGPGQRLCNGWASLWALGGHQGGSWLLGPDQASQGSPSTSQGACGAHTCEGNLAPPHRQLLASHQFHGTTVAQEQVFWFGFLLFDPHGVLGSHSPGGLGQLRPTGRVPGA